MGFERLTEKKVRPRKPRTCIWCGQKINVGQLCWYRASVLDGDFHTDYIHLECFDVLLEECRQEAGTFYFHPFENERPKPERTQNEKR